MHTYHDKKYRLMDAVPDYLRTAGMGLGLARLQMDIGQPEEARTTLASLQNDFQLLLHALQNPKDMVPREFQVAMELDSREMREEILAFHE